MVKPPFGLSIKGVLILVACHRYFKMNLFDQNSATAFSGILAKSAFRPK